MARRFSYTQEVKSELARIYDDDRELLIAEIAGMLSVSKGVDTERIDFYNFSAAVTRKLFKLIKKNIPNAKVEVAAVRTKVLRKSMKYAVRIFLTRHTENFINLSFDKIFERPILGVSYLRGAFLASGSVNRPEKKSRLEISFATQDAAELAQNIFKIFDMNAGLYERKGLFVTYIKENDSVCDFIGIIGAEKAVEHFEVARNVKEVRAMVNRIVNCETANLNKTITAAQKQISDIRLILEKKIEVEDHIKKAMDFRLQYPDDSISELAAKMYLTKQGLLYRLKVIHELAESLTSN